MRLIGHELKKVMGSRAVWGFAAILLIANAALCFLNTRHAADTAPPEAMVDSFFQLYEENPEQIRADYAAYNASSSERQRLAIQQARLTGEVAEVTLPPNQYAPEGYTDAQLYTALFNCLNGMEEYRTVTDEIIRRANANIREYTFLGYAPDSYAVRSQQYVVDRYTYAQEHVEMRFTYLHGWSEYFQNQWVNVFLLVSLILIDAVIFTQEMTSGFMPILRLSRNGRTRTAAAKLAAMMLLTVFDVLVFTGTTFAIYWLRLGMSDPGAAIQQLDLLVRSPLVLTVGQYFALQIGMRILVCLCFSAFLALFSVLLYNYVLQYLLGLALLGANYLMFIVRDYSADQIIHHMNLFAGAYLVPLTERLRILRLGTSVVEFLPLLAAGIGLAGICAAALCVGIYTHGAKGVKLQFVTRLAARIRAWLARRARPAQRTVRIRPTTIRAAELRKSLSGRVLAVLLAMLCLKCVLSARENRLNILYSESLYASYMTQLAGPITDEKRQYLAQERAWIDAFLARGETIEEEFASGRIDAREYMEYTGKSQSIVTRSEILQVVEAHAAYIDRMAEEGKSAWFVYDTGWKMLFNSLFDWTQYAAILFVCCSVFSMEYDSRSSSGGFAQILRTTRKGRRHTLLAKFSAAALISAVLCLIWNAVYAATLFHNYLMPQPEAPLGSVEMFCGIAPSMTLRGYGAVWILLRIFAAVLLGVLCAALSCLLRRAILAMSATVLVTLVPHLLVTLGFAILAKEDYVQVLRVTPVLLNGFGKGAVYLLVPAAAALLLLLAAASLWNGRDKALWKKTVRTEAEHGAEI